MFVLLLVARLWLDRHAAAAVAAARHAAAVAAVRHAAAAVAAARHAAAAVAGVIGTPSSAAFVTH